MLSRGPRWKSLGSAWASVGKVENELNGMSLFTSKNFWNNVLELLDFGLQSVILKVA